MIQNNGAVINGPVDIEVTDEALLSLGKDVTIRPFVSIVCKKRIGIGTGTQIGPGARIVDFDHEMGRLQNIEKVGKAKEILIGDYCWIGANAVLLKGTILHDGCIVGAGSVVIGGEYQKGSVIVGSPGKTIKVRDIDI